MNEETDLEKTCNATELTIGNQFLFSVKCSFSSTVQTYRTDRSHGVIFIV